MLKKIKSRLERDFFLYLTQPFIYFASNYKIE